MLCSVCLRREWTETAARFDPDLGLSFCMQCLKDLAKARGRGDTIMPGCDYRGRLIDLTVDHAVGTGTT